VPSGVIYARLSDVRKGDVEGIERQVREGEAHAAKLGVEVVERLLDNDVTAADRRKKRPAFERLMAGMAANEWDVVILRSLERWVRQPAELERIIEVAETSKVRVESLHGGHIDLTTRQGRLLARMMTAVAMDEVDAVKERTKDWHADRVARGLPPSGDMGYGFTADKTIDEAAAQRIREAAGMVLAGVPLRAIAREWNETGVPCPSRASTWRPSTIKRILVAPRIAGLRGYRGQVATEGTWPAIVDRATYERLVHLLTRPERNTATTRTPKLLTGIATCGKIDDNGVVCGKPLNSKWNHGGRRYYCRYCFGTMIWAEPLEKHVLADLCVVVDTPRLHATVAGQEVRGGPDELVAQITAIEADIDALAADLGAGGLSLAEHRIARAGMVQRLDRLRSELGRVERSATDEWEGKGVLLAEKWEEQPDYEKRRIVETWITEIRVAPATLGKNFFDKGRVAILWRA
jgi:site-specific DNA recombinase